jgi:small subunit ribosomal protein S19|uniref:Small ribosomal subunit protein uS19c n=2 Tax=Reclinomonas americana TaxID=48483 RepID=M4QCZ4_RECAM|nr:ribosomal protein S19 [Reclinomonas americana ATCC 50633]AGH24404.1 ribosomal protein S19 [Reclinomonas americana ATCC 50284]
MTRSIWKGPHVDSSLLSKIIKIKKIDSKKKINTWSRRSVVLPQFIGLSFNVYNGNRWVSVLVTEDMIGHKLGEFAPTRKVVKHKKK